jgi:3-deoxy-D-manno-octulosonate 8-phosphate phosphatase KdsC-like HAD superfamily phosphatase
MLLEKQQATGEVYIKLYDENGNLKQEKIIENLVVNLGLAYITSRLLSAAAIVMSHMAIGSGTTAAAGANTALETELARVALSSSVQETVTITNDSVKYVANFPAGTGTGAVTEAALLNAASVGTMLARTVFAVVNKAAGDAMTIEWVIKFAPAA